MRLLEQLFGYLTEVVDESNDGVALERIVDLVYIDGALVEEMMKHIAGVDGRLALLLKAEDEIDPFVEMCRDEVALERHAMHANELARVVLGPRRQHDIVESHAALLSAQIKSIRVDEELRQVEELWNQLLDVGHVIFGRRQPTIFDAVEHTIGQIKVSTL